MVAGERADACTRAWLLLMALGGLRCCEVALLRPVWSAQGEARTVLRVREALGMASVIPAGPALPDPINPGREAVPRLPPLASDG